MGRLNRRELLWRAGLGVGAYSLAGGWWGGAAMWAEEPHITISPLNKLSDEDEIELGRRFAAEYEKETEVISNILIDKYLGAMVLGLAENSQRPNLPYQIKLVNSHVPNACSLPGGRLYVNRGLIELIDNEAELAATLAHEVGHIVGRHTVNSLMLTFTARQMVKPVLENLHKANDVVEKIIEKLGGAVAMVAMLQFSRADESQADLLGFYEMLRAGWDPRGFLVLFAHIEEVEAHSGGVSNPFLSDHPATPERAAAIRHELEENRIPQGAANDSIKFQLFKKAMMLLPEPAQRAGTANT